MAQQEKRPQEASATGQMTAIVVEQTGGPEALTAQTREIPQPGQGQVLVRTEATGVNFIETYQRSGVYSVELPFVPGAEAVGLIEAAGPDVDLEALRPYFELERVLERGVFAAAEQLYGLTFTPRADLRGWNADTRVFEVHDEDGVYPLLQEA